MNLRAGELATRYLPKSALGNAVRYFKNEYGALIGYRQDGRYEINNNLVENAIGPTAVGRRRWLFIGHPDAGWRSAVLCSIIGSCRRRGINPQEYLTDILGRLPATKASCFPELLPANCKPKSTGSGWNGNTVPPCLEQPAGSVPSGRPCARLNTYAPSGRQVFLLAFSTPGFSHNPDVRTMDVTHVSVTVAEYQAILSTREDEFTERI